MSDLNYAAALPASSEPYDRQCSRLLMSTVLAACTTAAQYDTPRVLANVSIRGLTESSGIVASRRNPGVYWTHNDSGATAALYALDRRGRSLGKWQVRGARAYDWEDIAAGPGPLPGTSYLYIGGIGDNLGRRRTVTVYRLPEPDIAVKTRRTEQAEALVFEYPDGPHDAECLLIHPHTGHLYIVSKGRGRDAEVAAYKAAAPLRAGATIRLRKEAVLALPGTSLLSILTRAVAGRVTGGDISPDGTRVVLASYTDGVEAILPKGVSDFDQIWRGPWHGIDLGLRSQGEGVCYRLDGKAVLATSEGIPFPLIENVRLP